ncbi:MAG: hypothetical protein P8J93_06130 [SAR86 cluster bacterium]|nr:hypothetical protein [SAR86 cluster bacterium]
MLTTCYDEERKTHPDIAPYIVKKIEDLTVPHIASPDVHVDNSSKTILMYYHGLNNFGSQKLELLFLKMD